MKLFVSRTQVALFQLGDVTLFLSIYNRRRGGMGRKGREMIGWLSLGLNSSGSEELQHWNDMRTARQPTQVQRWHSLLRPWNGFEWWPTDLFSMQAFECGIIWPVLADGYDRRSMVKTDRTRWAYLEKDRSSFSLSREDTARTARLNNGSQYTSRSVNHKVRIRTRQVSKWRCEDSLTSLIILSVFGYFRR